MNIKWKILQLNPELGSIEVLYFDTDNDMTIGPMNLELPINNGGYGDWAEVEKFINAMTPIYQFEKHETMKNLPSMLFLEDKIGLEQNYIAPVLISTPILNVESGLIYSE